MMNLTLVTDYYSADGFQVVAIPYADNRLSLYAFIGENEGIFRDFESRLNPRVVNDLLSRTKKHVVDVSMPRFRLDDHFFLSGPLGALGMSRAFSLNADLSGIADSRENLRLGAVIHKTYLDLDEEGTEAAAATGVIGVNPISFSQPIPKAKIALDRPFLFLIRDNETGAVLFLGRLMNPQV
jgi:serpin B